MALTQIPCCLSSWDALNAESELPNNQGLMGVCVATKPGILRHCSSKHASSSANCSLRQD
ncbi:Uncharacterised protein [Vibrio cholerae]|nr:Uncharacterised protein [Vibrio cholerae]